MEVSMLGNMRIGIALACSLFAAGTMAPWSARADLPEAKARGKLIIATSGNLPPATFVDANNELDGYDIFIAREVGKRIGIPIQFERIDSKGMLPGLQTGRFDAVVSNINVLEERKAVFDFSIPYSRSAVVAITRAGNVDINSYKDLKGKVVGGITGGADGEIPARQISEKFGAFKEFKGYPGFSELFQDLAIGRIDAAITPEHAAADFSKQRPGIVKITSEAYQEKFVAAAFQKGSPQLKAAFDSAILELRKNGTLDQMAERYFGYKNYTKNIPEQLP
jgi:ABC-type amino acid transport substrate-binding protein